MKLAYNESMNFIEGYDRYFDIDGPSNLIEMVPVVGMEGMVSSTRLRYTRDYLTAAI